MDNKEAGPPPGSPAKAVPSEDEKKSTMSGPCSNKSKNNTEIAFLSVKHPVYGVISDKSKRLTYSDVLKRIDSVFPDKVVPAEDEKESTMSGPCSNKSKNNTEIASLSVKDPVDGAISDKSKRLTHSDVLRRTDSMFPGKVEPAEDEKESTMSGPCSSKSKNNTEIAFLSVKHPVDGAISDKGKRLSYSDVLRRNL